MSEKKHFVYSMSFNLQKNWQNYNSRRLSKPVGVQLVQFSAQTEYDRGFKVFTSIEFKASRLKKANLVPILVSKKLEFWNI